jgi:hypothetical protein
MRTLRTVSWHEAAHAIALFEGGERVLELTANAFGGSCLSARPFIDMRPETAFFASVVGAHGPSLLDSHTPEDIVDSSVPSPTDLDHFAEAAGMLDDLTQRRLLRAVGPWVFRHRREVETLASELAAKGVLRETDFYDLTRLHACLARFAYLYPTRPAPAQTHTTTHRVRGLRRVAVRAF